MKDEVIKIYSPLLSLFIVISILIWIFNSFLKQHGFDLDILFIANLLLFTLSFIAIFIQRKGLRSANTNYFVRAVYMALIIKMFICLTAAFVYAFIYRSYVNKPVLFTSMGIYFAYAAVEVTTLLKSARKRTNAKKRVPAATA